MRFIHFLSCVVIIFGATDAQVCHNRYEVNYHTLDNFTNHACLDCLDMMILPETSFVFKDATVFGWLINIPQFGNVIHMPAINYPLDFTELQSFNGDVQQHPILGQFSADCYRESFMKCCRDARKCCQKMEDQRDQSDHCPMKWDGWSCWSQGNLNTTHYQLCPDEAYIEDPPPWCVRSLASKTCMSNGEWVEMTDYSKCYIVARDTRISLISTTVICQSISLAFVTIGLFLFLYFRLLFKFRIRIHANYFLSIIFSNLITIMYNIFVTKAHIDDTNTAIYDNPHLCKLFTFLFKDIRLLNFWWMTIEGLFFHHIVAFPFYELARYQKTIYWCGWMTSHLVMLIYTSVRLKYGNDRCWTDIMGYEEWIFLIFPYICLGVNVILFLNLIRVIFQKLIFPKSSRFTAKGIKTSLILIPVFGIQYIVHIMPVDPSESCDSFDLSLKYTQVVVEGLQGVIVTTILCFMDKDVYICIRRTLRRKESSAHTSQHFLTEDSKPTIFATNNAL